MPTNQEVSVWAEKIDAVSRVIGPRFSRRDLRAHSESYLRGLISRVERKNGWQMLHHILLQIIPHFPGIPLRPRNEVLQIRRRLLTEFFRQLNLWSEP